MLVAELDTPAVIIDLDIMERNLDRLAVYCQEHGLRLRPHTKTHKIPELAQQQIRQGAQGITVAKIGEAEVMVGAGIKDVLVAYPIVGPQKAERLAKLAERSSVTVSLDSETAAVDIARQARTRQVTIGVLIELDVGFRRCGLTDVPQAVELARRVVDLPGLELLGLMFYPGHLLVERQRRLELAQEINLLLQNYIEAFEHEQLPISIISGGSTPTAYISHLFHGVNEIRPGMYLFNDRNMLGADVCTIEDCALSVRVTVVSNAVRGQVIVDGGTKTFSSDRYLAGGGSGFGLVKEDFEADMTMMSEEHGHISIAHSTRKYRIGEHLSIIPNHVCTTINMHNSVYAARGERVVAEWNIAGRGKVS